MSPDSVDRTLLLVAAGAALAFPMAVWAKPVPPRGVFVYSNVCWEHESGDAAGYRITVRRFEDESDVIFDHSEGVMEALVSTDSTINDKTGAFKFLVRTDSTRHGVVETSTFTGTITDEEVVGTMAWAGGKVRLPLRLPRVKVFVTKTPDCK